MTQGNQEHRYVGTTDEGLLPESVEDLRGMQEFWQKQVPMNGRTVADSVHDEIEIVPGKITCEQYSEKNENKNQVVYVSPHSPRPERRAAHEKIPAAVCRSAHAAERLLHVGNRGTRDNPGSRRRLRRGIYRERAAVQLRRRERRACERRR